MYKCKSLVVAYNHWIMTNIKESVNRVMRTHAFYRHLDVQKKYIGRYRRTQTPVFLVWAEQVLPPSHCSWFGRLFPYGICWKGAASQPLSDFWQSQASHTFGKGSKAKSGSIGDAEPIEMYIGCRWLKLNGRN